MGNARSAVGSNSANQDQWSGEADERDASGERVVTHSHVFPVAPQSTWRSVPEIEAQLEPLASELSGAGEYEFWNTTPRDSSTNLPSLAPAPVGQAPSRWRTWLARILFAIIYGATLALLGLEMRALAAQEGAPRIADSHEPGSAANQLLVHP